LTIVVVNCRAVAVAVAENWAVHRHYPNLVPPDLFLDSHELAARSHVRDLKLNYSTLQPRRELSLTAV
jgi:hypothetical protein